MIFCAAARKLKNITKSRFCQRKILLCSLCMYVFLKPVALPKGDTHTRTPNFRSFCALPFAAFRRIDFAGVCLLESVLLSADNKWILNPYLFVVFVCSYFLPKGGIKNSHFASLFNTHKYILFIHTRTIMAPTTQQKILAAYNGFYGMFSLCLLRLV
jgi:hypothetical protein